MQVLVTGGAGFIGSHLTESLAAAGHRVRVFDNLSSGSRARCGPGVELVEGDIRDLAAVQAACEGAELVFHLAAMVSVVQSIEQPIAAESTNAMGTLHVLEAARQAGARRVVLASSCAVYGDTQRLPTSESDPTEPLSPYAATKLAAECLGRLYSRLYEVEAVSLRFFNVYGPRQDPSSPYAAAVPRFIQALREGRQPTIYGDGGQTRDFVYVGDIAAALWAAAVAPRAAGGVYNVGTGESRSVLELVGAIAEILGVRAEPAFAPARGGEVRHSQADTRLLRDEVGFCPSTTLREGLAQTIRASS